MENLKDRLKTTETCKWTGADQKSFIELKAQLVKDCEAANRSYKIPTSTHLILEQGGKRIYSLRRTLFTHRWLETRQWEVPVQNPLLARQREANHGWWQIQHPHRKQPCSHWRGASRHYTKLIISSQDTQRFKWSWITSPSSTSSRTDLTEWKTNA